MANAEVIKKWEEMQTKTFTKWVNMHLAKKGMSITSVLNGFQDGVKLINLMEVIGEATLPKHVQQPKMRIQQLENIGKALKFIEERGVKLASIGPNDICDGNVKLTLGMIWTIILRFEISELGAEGLSAKQGLLLWCQNKTKGYNNVDVQDFQDSFKDGLAFCAIIHKHRPDLIAFESLSPENARENLDTAFNAAESLGIPKLLDTEDIVSMPKPDERSIMTYCAALYKYFSSSDQSEKAGRRLGKYAELLRQAEAMIHDYEEKAKALLESINGKIQEINGTKLGNDVAVIREQNKSFKEYRKTTKRTFVASSAELLLLLGNIQSKLRSLQRAPYVPPEGLKTEDIKHKMNDLFKCETEHMKALNNQIRLILDRLRKEFATPANEFYDKLMAFQELLVQEQPDIEKAIQFLTNKLAEMRNTLQGRLAVIDEKEKACEEAGIEDNEYTHHTTDDLEFNLSQVGKGYENKIAFLNGQLEESKGSSITAEQLAEIKRSFDHFDADHNGTLDKLEFKSVLSAMGVIDVNFSGEQDSKFEKIFADVSEGNTTISYAQYQAYVISITEDKISPKQLAESLEAIAKGKNHITEADLRSAQMSDENVQYLLSVIPKKSGVEGGYDHVAWISQLA